MNKIITLLFLIVSFSAQAQLKEYVQFQELEDPKPKDLTSWETYTSDAYSGFVSVDEHFHRSSAPVLSQISSSWEGKGWKGERVHTQALIWTNKELKDVNLSVEELVGPGSSTIPKGNIRANFVRYTLTDHLGDLTSGCGIPAGLDTSLHADLIDDIANFTIKDQTSRPLWLSVDIPQNAQAGIYKGILTISSPDYNAELPFQVEVINRVLPAASEWTYHLDIWQNPYSVARVHGVEPWSDQHFEVMKPVMTRLADAGQKNITASIIYDPWNAQTYDIYGSMIQWTKKKDGSWEYDYSIFDKWVQYMMDLGIDEYINCYSMIPWNLKFYYHDEASNSEKLLVATPGTTEYKNHWQNMLEDFAKHLKKKGWFDKTTIAMDERPEEHMNAAIDIIKSADPDYMISMAGVYHPDLQDKLVDYSVAYQQPIPHEVIEERRAKGLKTTFYTCCAEPYPNTFTSSPYAEATWLSWHALNLDFDGYLRWAYNNWTEDPQRDSRFRSWAAGDTYLVYPGNRTSIRFERLREGIQDFEKAKILREELKKSGDSEHLNELEAAIKAFDAETLKTTPASVTVNAAKAVLNK